MWPNFDGYSKDLGCIFFVILGSESAIKIEVQNSSEFPMGKLSTGEINWALFSRKNCIIEEHGLMNTVIQIQYKTTKAF